MSQQGRPPRQDGGKPQHGRPGPGGRGGSRGGPGRPRPRGGSKMGPPGKGGPRSRGQRLSQHQKRQLFDLVEKSNIPKAAAMRVVLGQSSLNDVLQEMMVEDKIKSYMVTHGFNRALATSVALGRADLDTILLRRRKNETLEANYDRSVLDGFTGESKSISLALHGHERVQGLVVEMDKYGCHFRPDGEEDTIEIHKTKIKYAFDAKDYKVVRKAHSVDSKVRKMSLDPILRVKDRYHFKNLTLQEAIDSKQSIRVTTLEGDVFEGGVLWFGRWEFCLRVKGAAEVTLFRHGIYRVEALNRPAPSAEKPRRATSSKGSKAKKKRRR